MSKLTIDQFLEKYEEAREDALLATHTIKKGFSINKKWPDFHVYTDGSSKGCKQSKDNRSFSGWGYFVRSVSLSGETRTFAGSGNLFNADSNEAELKAVHAAISSLKIPARVHLVSDSSYIIKGLRDIESKIELKNTIEQTPVAERKTWQWKELRLLNLWSEINELIQGSKVLSLDAHWVRSHTVDREEDFPGIEEARNQVERDLLTDSIGNYYADQQANLGAKKAVHGALWFFKNETNRQKIIKSIPTCAKNFSNSSFSRDEAISFLSKQEPDFLPKEILTAIFDSSMLTRIENITLNKQKEVCASNNTAISINIANTGIIDSDSSRKSAIERFHKKYSGIPALGLG